MAAMSIDSTFDPANVAVVSPPVAKTSRSTAMELTTAVALSTTVFSAGCAFLGAEMYLNFQAQRGWGMVRVCFLLSSIRHYTQSLTPPTTPTLPPPPPPPPPPPLFSLPSSLPPSIDQSIHPSIHHTTSAAHTIHRTPHDRVPRLHLLGKPGVVVDDQGCDRAQPFRQSSRAHWLWVLASHPAPDLCLSPRPRRSPEIPRRGNRPLRVSRFCTLRVHARHRAVQRRDEARVEELVRDGRWDCL